MSARKPLLEVRRLGRTDYVENRVFQEECVTKRIAGEVPDLLLLTEHGAETTGHAPGQVVACPILSLAADERDTNSYLRRLEEIVLRVLLEFDVEGRRSVGHRIEGRGGVWVGEQKLASIDVLVRDWVTSQGLVLNVHTDLEDLARSRPGGPDQDPSGRLADLAELPPGCLLVEVLLVKAFCEVFDRRLPDVPAAVAPVSPSTGSSAPGADGWPVLPILPS